MQYRTLFISDLHLGSVISQIEPLLDFLKENHFEKIAIIGDFIDFWALKKGSKHWHQSHNDVVQKLLRIHRKGIPIVWIAGNHDEFIAQFSGMNFGGIDIKLNDIHIAADGKRYLLMHGHELDVVMKNAKWLMHVGTWFYDLLILMNPYVNKVSWLFGLRHWSLSQFVKHKCKQAVNFIGDFEKGIVEYAKHAKCDGVIAGHIHVPVITTINDTLYLNCGDWVESLSCIVEDLDGKMILLKRKENEMRVL